MRSIWKSDKCREILGRLETDLKGIRLALVVLAVYIIGTQSVFGTVCPWAILTHLPCPACGLTRAGLCLATLHFREAIDWNAMIFLWGPYLLYLAITRYILGQTPRLVLGLATIIALVTCIYFGVRIWRGTIPVNILPFRLYSFPSIW